MYQEIFDMETETEARSKKRKSEREIVRKIEKTFEKTAVLLSFGNNTSHLSQKTEIFCGSFAPHQSTTSAKPPNTYAWTNEEL